MNSLIRRIEECARQDSDRLAFPGWSYQKLTDFVRQPLKAGSVVELQGSSLENLLMILRAMAQGRPVIIRPERPKKALQEAGAKSLPADSFSLTLFSSGTTGKNKAVRQPWSMIEANIKNAIEVQSLTVADRVLTVSRICHAGGLHAQTLAALYVGAFVDVRPFSAYEFLKIAGNYTLTHLVPDQIRALKMTKGWSSFQKGQLRFVMCGSDPVTKELVEDFVDKEIPFCVNYGMSEAGPIICNTVIHCREQLRRIYEAGVPIGCQFWTEYEIRSGELFLKGEPVVSEDWLPTGDLVEPVGDCFYFRGRQ